MEMETPTVIILIFLYLSPKFHNYMFVLLYKNIVLGAQDTSVKSEATNK